MEFRPLHSNAEPLSCPLMGSGHPDDRARLEAAPNCLRLEHLRAVPAGGIPAWAVVPARRASPTRGAVSPPRGSSGSRPIAGGASCRGQLEADRRIYAVHPASEEGREGWPGQAFARLVSSWEREAWSGWPVGATRTARAAAKPPHPSPPSPTPCGPGRCPRMPSVATRRFQTTGASPTSIAWWVISVRRGNWALSGEPSRALVWVGHLGGLEAARDECRRHGAPPPTAPLRPPPRDHARLRVWGLHPAAVTRRPHPGGAAPAPVGSHCHRPWEPTHHG